MQKKGEVRLYDGGLIALLVFVCILAVVAVGQRAKEVRRECEERLARERRAIPYYSDDELITNYYQIDAELQGLLESAEVAMILPMGEGFIASSGKRALTKKRINTVRQIRALYLAEIARRGLKLLG